MVAQLNTNKVRVSLAVEPNHIQMNPKVAKKDPDMNRKAGNSMPETRNRLAFIRLLRFKVSKWASSIKLFMPEGWQSLPHRKLWRGLVSRNLPKFPMR